MELTLEGRSFQIRCEVELEGGRLTYCDQDFTVTQTEFGWEGNRPELRFQLVTTPAGAVRMKLENRSGLQCNVLRWYLAVTLQNEDLACARVPLWGKDVEQSGLVRLSELGEMKPDSCLTGLFFAADRPCLLLGTTLPQKNLHLYQVRQVSRHTVEFCVETSFPVGQRSKKQLTSEETWIIQGKTPLAVLQDYAENHVPASPKPISPPVVGWNSWDYYFRTVSAADILENAEWIREDDRLRDRLHCIIIDDGWAHCEGEWYANYRFPDGLKSVADRLTKWGFVPGIWTNGCQINTLSYPAMRQSGMLLRKENGCPLSVDGLYVIDPTHPEGEKFLFELYRRLYEYGFRVFKVDFVGALQSAVSFYDTEAGPYDAIRHLFEIVREAVGSSSHIIGCSYPIECGPGAVDSCRIGVDIHNQWTHAAWCTEYLQLRFWCGRQMFRIDPDFLLVRGAETSKETETNVFNPSDALPFDSDARGDRWRRGPVFDRLEAETWANLTVFAGGNLLSSDRLPMLNELGLRLLYDHLVPLEKPAEPLDLGDGELASVWFSGNKLLLINHASAPAIIQCDFSRFGQTPPERLYGEKPFSYENGCVSARLERHESIVLTL